MPPSPAAAERALIGGAGARGAGKEKRTVEILRSLAGRVYMTLSAARDKEEGQAMVEYALILFLVSIVSIGVLTLLGTQVSSVFSEIVADI
jgi:pilus assembly protein Flp/PilA